MIRFSPECDRCRSIGYEHTGYAPQRGKPSLTFYREQLRRAGWRVRKVGKDWRDYCPECVKEMDAK